MRKDQSIGQIFKAKMAAKGWRTQLAADTEQVPVATQVQTTLQRVRALEQENRELRAEIDLLRRAAAYFASHMV